MKEIIVSAIATVSDFLANLGLEVGKEHLKRKIDEHKLHEALKMFIESQREYNEVCSLAEEIDFQGLIEYLQDNLLSDIETRIFCVNPKERGRARDAIVSTSVAFSKASTEEAKLRVSTLIAVCIDIIRDFYRKGISKQDYLLAAEIVDSVNEYTGAVAASTQDILVQKMKETSDENIQQLTEFISKGTLYSLDRMVSEAGQGNLDFANTRMREILAGLSSTHPLFPEYGYDVRNKMLVSTPLTPQASQNHPVHYKFSGPVRVGGQYINDPNVDPMDYAYRHQLSMVMNVQEAKKYLGDIEDPAHYEMDHMVGRELYAKPPEFPPAFPCSILVKDQVFFDYILLRTQEILDDGTYVFGNREQTNCHFYFEIQVKLPDLQECDGCEEESPVTITEHTGFTIHTHDVTNAEWLKFVRFMQALSTEQDLRIHVLSSNQDIIAGMLVDVNYQTGFSSVDEEIDFLERICDIEQYYNVALCIRDEIDEEAYSLVIQLSELIRNDEVTNTWSNAKFTGIVDEVFRNRLIEMSDEMYMISYIGYMDVHIMNAEFEVKYMRTYKSAILQDYDRIKQLALLLKDGDTINLDFIPGEDKSVIDTLKIPEGVGI